MGFTGLDDVVYRTTVLGQSQTVDWSKVSVNTAAETNAGWHEFFTAQGNPGPMSFGTVKNTLAGAAPKAVCVGPDGNLWVADGASALWQISPTGEVLAKYTGLTQAASICVGPDNNLWIGSDISAIYRFVISTSTLSSFSIGSVINGITAGPDGNLWATDQANAAVYKINTSGTLLNTYTLTASTPEGICSDGTNLWVADQAGAVWKVTTGGVSTKFTFGSLPNGIVFGPDGNLWVTDLTSGHGVWKVTTGGTPTQYTLSGTSNCFNICSDGTNLWTGDGSTLIWKVATSGSGTSYPIPYSTNPVGLCYDSTNQNVWVADSGGAAWRIATSINPGAAIAPTSATIGAMPLNVNVSPSTRHLLNMQALSDLNIGTVMLVDLLLYYPNLVVTGTPTTINNTNTLPRYTSGSGVMGAMLVQTPLGAASPNLALTFTANDNSTQTSSCIANNNSLQAGQLFTSGTTATAGGPFLTIPAGLSGIKTLQSYTITAGSTTGLVCFALFKPIMSIPVTAINQISEMEYLNQYMSLPQIQDGACLGLLIGGTAAFATSLIPLQGRLQYIYGP